MRHVTSNLIRFISKMAYLFIASGKLGMFQRQMGVASVPYQKVISKRDMLISVLSYVSVDGCAISSGRMLNKHQVQTCTLRHW